MVSLKAFLSKAKKVEEDDEKFDEVSSKQEEMDLLIDNYCQPTNKNWPNHYDKKFINLNRFHPHRNKEKSKEKEDTLYECGKYGYYRTTCLSLNKHNNKKDIDSYKTKGNFPKVIELISHRKTNTKVSHHLQVRAKMMNLQISV